MSSRAGRARRAGRGVAAATLATFVTTVAHSSVSAAPPAVENIVLALCLAAPVCVLLAGRALSWMRLSMAVVFSQSVFHALLALDLRAGGAPAPADHHAAMTMFLDAAAPGTAAPSGDVHSPAMWIAHAVAAVLTTVALGLGERAVQAIVGFLSATFRAIQPVLLRGAAAPRELGPLPTPTRVSSGIAVLSVMRHRGPPLTA